MKNKSFYRTDLWVMIFAQRKQADDRANTRKSFPDKPTSFCDSGRHV